MVARYARGPPPTRPGALGAGSWSCGSARGANICSRTTRQELLVDKQAPCAAGDTPGDVGRKELRFTDLMLILLLYHKMADLVK